MTLAGMKFHEVAALVLSLLGIAGMIWGGAVAAANALKSETERTSERLVAEARFKNCQAIISAGNEFWERMADFSSNADAIDRLPAGQVEAALTERRRGVMGAYRRLLRATQEAGPEFSNEDYAVVRHLQLRTERAGAIAWKTSTSPATAWGADTIRYHAALSNIDKTKGASSLLDPVRHMCAPK
jgi:hypothetical protein